MGKGSTKLGHWPPTAAALDSPPVFQGLEDTGLSGKEIADLAGVSPPTVSKWRSGKRRVPADVGAFLTLMLAQRIDDIRTQVDGAGPRGAAGFWMKTAIEAGRDALVRQEELNLALHPEALRDGARRFREWWQTYGNGAPAGAPGVFAPETGVAPSMAAGAGR